MRNETLDDRKTIFEALKGTDQMPVVVTTGSNVPWRHVVDVLRACRQNGLLHIIFDYPPDW